MGSVILVGSDWILAEAELLFEDHGAPVANPLAIDQRDVTAKDATLDPTLRDRLAELELHAHTWKQTPIGFDQCATGRKVNDLGGSAGTHASAGHLGALEC
jgi:hypothetical protein